MNLADWWIGPLMVCPDCGCYTQFDEEDPEIVLHWSTGREECSWP